MKPCVRAVGDVEIAVAYALSYYHFSCLAAWFLLKESIPEKKLTHAFAVLHY